MSLIKCSECGKEISDKAGACPACGNPIHIQSSQPVVIQEKVEVVQTSKKWKWLYLLGILFIFIGFSQIGNSPARAFGFIFLAFVIIFIAGVGSWWTNG